VALMLAEQLRELGVRVECDCSGASLKSQMKRADRSGARWAWLIGDDERARGVVAVKDLRGGTTQSEMALSRVPDYVKTCLTINGGDYQ
jgi:histidyl-tRNA synthetase